MDAIKITAEPSGNRYFKYVSKIVYDKNCKNANHFWPIQAVSRHRDTLKRSLNPEQHNKHRKYKQFRFILLKAADQRIWRIRDFMIMPRFIADNRSALRSDYRPVPDSSQYLKIPRYHMVLKKSH